MKHIRFFLPALFLLPFSAHALKWGVNVDWKTLSQTLPLLQQRRITAIRVNAAFDYDKAAFRSAMIAAKAKGITPTAIFFTSLQWDTNCTQDLAAAESKAYSQTYAFVNALKDVVTDWEMQNENDISTVCPLKPLNLGRNASDWDNPNMRLKVAVIRGIARAIGDIRTQSKIPLRRMLGFTTFHTGFVDYMLNHGVQFEIINYHYYEREGVTPYNGNFDLANPTNSGWNIFAALARYNRPIHINEFNAAEIYQDGYYNAAGDALTEKGYRSLKVQMEYWRTAQATVKQKYGVTINLETVSAYCLLDDPSKGNPYSGLARDAESRFGMMFDLTHPKVSLLLLSAYAGGNLSASEANALISRGLLTQAQINSMRPAPSLTFPSTITMKNGVAVTLAPTVVSPPASWNCSAVLLVNGLTINPTTCVISGTPRISGSIPASGYVQTTTIQVGALNSVIVRNFTILP